MWVLKGIRELLRIALRSMPMNGESSLHYKVGFLTTLLACDTFFGQKSRVNFYRNWGGLNHLENGGVEFEKREILYIEKLLLMPREELRLRANI